MHGMVKRRPFLTDYSLVPERFPPRIGLLPLYLIDNLLGNTGPPQVVGC